MASARACRALEMDDPERVDDEALGNRLPHLTLGLVLRDGVHCGRGFREAHHDTVEQLMADEVPLGRSRTGSTPRLAGKVPLSVAGLRRDQIDLAIEPG